MHSENAASQPATVLNPAQPATSSFGSYGKSKKLVFLNRFPVPPRFSKPPNRYRNIIGSNGCCPNSAPSLSRSAGCGPSKQLQWDGVRKKKKDCCCSSRSCKRGPNLLPSSIHRPTQNRRLRLGSHRDDHARQRSSSRSRYVDRTFV